MSFSVSQRGETVVVTVEGQLVVANRRQLKQAVLDEIDRGGRRFVIDFANASYIDSAGLGVLVSLSKKIRENRGQLLLQNLNEDLRTLFELTKLDTLFEIDSSGNGERGKDRARDIGRSRGASEPGTGDGHRPERGPPSA
jgi:anti-sigma B factor antagonist